MNATLETFQEAAVIVRPPPALSTSQWAEKYRVIAPGKSPAPGRWRNDTQPQLVGIMDAFDDPAVKRIVVKKASRAGATECWNNAVGRRIHLDPTTILYCQAGLPEARKYSSLILDPTIDATPCLKAKISRDARNKDNTKFLKTFPGGAIVMVGVVTANALRMIAAPLVGCDDVDAYEGDVGGEGDPVAIAEERAAGFWYAKIFLASSPTIEGLSRIDTAYKKSDQRHYYVPCQNCGEYQQFVWLQLKWDHRQPMTARYECEYCEFPHKHHLHKKAMLRAGEWQADADFIDTAGFHLSRLYNSFIPWTQIVADWLRVFKNPEERKVFVNHTLGLCYEEEHIRSADSDVLYRNNREIYPPVKAGDPAAGYLVPEGVYVLTMAVDVQHDRLECEVLGHGMNEETWSIRWFQIPCDTSILDNYEQKLEPHRKATFKHVNGVELRIVGTCIDSSDGARTDVVYQYCKDKFDENVYAIKGAAGAGRVLASTPTHANSYNCPLFTVGVDTAKHAIYAHLKMKEHGPGYCHFPREYVLDYFKQLTAEKAVRRKVAGKMAWAWVKTQNRNEALDCRVYNMAALVISGANIEDCRKQIETQIQRLAGVAPVKEKTERRELSAGAKPE